MMGEMSLRPQRVRPQLPLDTLPDLHSPKIWYSASLPPYEMNNWKDVYQERHEKDGIVRMLLEEIVEDSRNRMRHMDGIASVGMVHARDVLENIIAGRNGEQRDLSRMYYARKALRRLQRGWVLDQWRAYRSNQQSFPVWQGCGLMAMFSDHEMELSDLDRQFESLAEEFLVISPLEDLEDQDSTTTSTPPMHTTINNFGRFSPSSPSSFATQDSITTTSSLRSGFTHNSSAHGMDTLNEKYALHYDSQVERLKDLIRFFTQEKGFKGNTENYYDPFNSFIDKVLVRKVGIPISLCVVFAELAHRVGVTGVELMGFPQHFMIRYRPPKPNYDLGSSPLMGSELASTATSPLTPPTYFLDLFHPPHRLLSMNEYEDYFSSLNIPQPPRVYRELTTPPLEIFLRCLRNIVLAVEQTGGAGRIGSDHQTSLYSGITQLLALHPSEEWGLYVLWLKYLSNFWPEDIGFIRMAIEDMELTDHRRTQSAARTMGSLSPGARPHHVFTHGRGGLSNMSTSPFTSSTQETIKILRAQVRELEMTDEAGDVGQIRRRRRPKVAVAAAASPLTPGTSSYKRTSLHIVDDAVHDVDEPAASSSNTRSHAATSPTIDDHLFHAHHQSLRHSSVTGEQQSGSAEGNITVQHERENTGGSFTTTASFGGEERRRPEPEYYVGEVFRHLIYRYTGVIYGYDLKCEAEEGWIRSMGIDSYVRGRYQPFYNALLSDGSRRYVAEENIQVLFRDHRQSSSTRPSVTTGPSLAHPLESEAVLAIDSSNATIMDVTEAIAPSSSSLSSADMSAATIVSAGTGASEASDASSEAIVGSLETPAPAAEPSTIVPAMTFTLYHLQFSELGPLGIEAVGQYFEAWDGERGHYVMNKELRKLYPTEDYL
ncbi:hypothetical protein BGX28_006723 [Mortierella sp. GBA30]|nr:hypothetical protein BGX28_006723 [Mortierella sp. GBA30]